MKERSENKSERKGREIDTTGLGLVYIGVYQTAFELGHGNCLPHFNCMRNRKSITPLHGQNQ